MVAREAGAPATVADVAAREASAAATAADVAKIVASALTSAQTGAAVRVLMGGEREEGGATGPWAVDHDDPRIGPEVFLRHFIISHWHGVVHVRKARAEYERRLEAACCDVANTIAACCDVADTIGVQGCRQLAGLRAVASLFTRALADRRVCALTGVTRGQCGAFGGDCLPWHRLAEVLGPSLGVTGQRAEAGLPYTLVTTARELAEAVVRIEPPSVVAVDTEGDGTTLLLQVAAADKRGGIHTLMAWSEDVEAYTALRALVRGCHRVYVWSAKSDGMAGLGYGRARNEKLVDLQAHYAPDLVHRAWATSGLPAWASDPAKAGVALDRTWSATFGSAMGTAAAKDAMTAPTRRATTTNSGWVATRDWTRMPGPRPALHDKLPYVQPGACPADMLLYAASDAAATLALGFVMETLRLEPTLTYTEGRRRFEQREAEYNRDMQNVFFHGALRRVGLTWLALRCVSDG